MRLQWVSPQTISPLSPSRASFFLVICASSELSLSSSHPTSPCSPPLFILLLYLPSCGLPLSNLLLPLSSNTHQALLFCPHHHLFCFMLLSLSLLLLLLNSPSAASSPFSLALLLLQSPSNALLISGILLSLHSLCRCYFKTWHSWTFERACFRVLKYQHWKIWHQPVQSHMNDWMLLLCFCS